MSATDTEIGFTAALIRRARAIRFDAIPADALEVARQCWIDFVACAVAGADDPLVDILVAEVAEPENSDEAGLIARPGRATCSTAALINGAAGHALDFDDTHTSMMGHPSVPVVPAVLALAEAGGADGRRALEAFVAGVEVECALGVALGVGHYARGFHATATVGTFGATAAAAHLLDLTEDQWMHALGLAGTQAAGLKVSFGTMAKPLHAGRAAAIGVQSARLARAGFTAAAGIVEIDGGFSATHAGADMSRAPHAPERFAIRDTLFKHHAACYLTHAAIEAAAHLRREHGLVVGDVESVEVAVTPGLFDVCNIENPRTGLEGKFSLRATTAMALRGDDTADPATFTDEKLGERALAELWGRVHVIGDESLTPSQARVEVRAAGVRAERIHDSGRPAEDLAEQRTSIERKFRGLTTTVLGAERSESLLESLGALDSAESVADLMRAAQPR